MNDFFNSSNTILDFLTLLEVEQSKKKTSNLFNAEIWQDLDRLKLELNTLSKPNKIALAILDWCEKYPEIDLVLKDKNWPEVRCDMVGDDDLDIPITAQDNEGEIIRNRDRIQKLIQDNQPQPDQDLPNNPQAD